MLDLNRELLSQLQSRLNSEMVDRTSHYIQNVLSTLQCATPEDLGDVDKSTQKKEIVFVLQTSYGQIRTVKLSINISEQPFRLAKPLDQLQQLSFVEGAKEPRS